MYGVYLAKAFFSVVVLMINLISSKFDFMCKNKTNQLYNLEMFAS